MHIYPVLPFLKVYGLKFDGIQVFDVILNTYNYRNMFDIGDINANRQTTTDNLCICSFCYYNAVSVYCSIGRSCKIEIFKDSCVYVIFNNTLLRYNYCHF